jgi:hypothetical protein
MIRRLLALVALCALGVAAGFAASSRGDIPVYTASTIRPYTSSTLTPTTAKTSTSSSCGCAAKPLSFFAGDWGTWVPGATWEGADYIWFSTGAQGHTAHIGADRGYRWHGVSGRWRPIGDGEYPLVLVHALDGHNWKVGAACGIKGAQVVLSDGYTYFFAKRVRGHG